MAQYSKELKSMLFKTLSYVHCAEVKYNQGRRQIVLDGLDIGLLKLLETPRTVKNISEMTPYEHSYILKRVNKFTKDGLTHKELSAEDKRMGEYRLTTFGKQCCEDAIERINRPLDFAAAELTVKEEKAVLKYLSRLHQALRNLE